MTHIVLMDKKNELCKWFSSFEVWPCLSNYTEVNLINMY